MNFADESGVSTIPLMTHPRGESRATHTTLGNHNDTMNATNFHLLGVLTVLNVKQARSFSGWRV